MMRQPRRDWKDARAKAERQGCRVCGDPRVETAHLVGRHRDGHPCALGRYPEAPTKKSTLYVEPVRVIGLCRPHHRAFDAHDFDLLGYLTREEEAQAVLDSDGLELARTRLCPSEYK